MFFSKFEISNYRSFSGMQTLKFAIPQESHPGSGITYIVGENNSGKTSLIEGMLKKDGENIRTSEKRGAGPTFTLFNQEGVAVSRVVLNNDRSITLKADPRPHNSLFELIPSKRNWSAMASGSSLENVVKETEKIDAREGSDTYSIAGALKDIDSDNARYDEFISLIQEVIPNFTSYSVGSEGSPYIQYTTTNSTNHRTEFLGEGVLSILRILIHLFNGDVKMLIIDEPELSLHPLAQKRLLKVLSKYSDKRQVVLVTHSPYFISWDCIENGAVLNKITKFDDVKSEIHTLREYDVYKKLISGANWQQPFLMDITAKEIFFHDNIFFVEGQEDVGLLRKEVDPEINFFGYGVRGIGAFKLCLTLARDLGIKKAAVLLDGGTKESAVISELKKDNPNEYLIIQWNKEDIRDKPEIEPKEAKQGYFTDRGIKKDPENLDDFNDKIKNINDFFSS